MQACGRRAQFVDLGSETARSTSFLAPKAWSKDGRKPCLAAVAIAVAVELLPPLLHVATTVAAASAGAVAFVGIVCLCSCC